MNAPVTIDLRISGYPRVLIDGIERPLKLKRAWAVLVFLFELGRKVSREHLATLLWPDANAALGRTRLRRVVHQLNALLEREVVIGDTDALWLNADVARLRSDVGDLRHAARAIVSTGADLPARELEPLLAPTSHAFLEGFVLDSESFSDWIAQRRIDHERLIVRALEWIAVHQAHEGDPALALAAADQLLAIDPCIENAHAARIFARARKGDAAGSEAAYFDCAQALRTELGIRPSAKVEQAHALAQDVLQRRNDAVATPQRPPPVLFADIGDGCVAYCALGRGAETIVVVPGLLSHIELALEEPRLRRAIERLAARHRVVVLDRRGTGLSERIGVQPDAFAAVRDIEAVIDAAGVADAWVFGAAVGGTVAIEFAATRPHRTRGLLLYGTHARGSWATDYPWALTAAGLEKWLARLRSEWGGPTSLGAFTPSNAGDPQVQAWWARMLRQSTSRQGIETLIRAMHQMDVRHRLWAVRAPTLVIQREDDRIVQAGAARYIAAAIAGSRLTLLPGADHWWWHGDADAVLRALETFIAEHARAPASAPSATGRVTRAAPASGR